MTQTDTREDLNLAPTIDALYAVYASLSRHTEQVTGKALPPVAITVQRDLKKWGHITTRPAWVAGDVQGYEVMISGENLARGAVAVFGTLAHEAAHALNIVNGVQDTDSNGRHNRRFKDTAERVFGLSISQAGRLGWSATEVPPVTVERWADEIARIGAAISAVSAGLGDGGKPKKGRDKNLLSAVCGCGKKIRVSRQTLPFVGACRACGDDFTAGGEG